MEQARRRTHVKCPYCQADTKVMAVDNLVTGTIRRRRWCKKRGEDHAFSTWQKPGEKEKLGEDYQPVRRGK